MIRRLLCIGALAGAVLGTASATLANRATQPPAPPVFIAEDEPGWNCATMGNQHC